MKGVEKMNTYPTTFRHKKRVIKLECVIATWYVVITLFKYFITSNPNIGILLFDLMIDTIIGIVIYQITYIVRKELNL